MKQRAVGAALVVIGGSCALAGPPSYEVEFLGNADHVDAINEAGQVVGWASVDGNSRGCVGTPGEGLTILPLPEGMVSSVARDINDAGVIVGSAGPFFIPEFSGEAVRWVPVDGGYEVELLGKLPGDVMSEATATNDLGDVVGFSFDGTFKRAVLFTAPEGVLDLNPTGIFIPTDLNDERVAVSGSKLLDLDTMDVEDLGVPPPDAFGDYVTAQGYALSNSGIVAGTTILATGQNCNHRAARHTPGEGWVMLSNCGPFDTAYGVNDAGDVIMQRVLDNYVHFAGIGTFRVQDLLVDQSWIVINSYGNDINNARELGVLAFNDELDLAGIVLLVPVGGCAADVNGDGELNILDFVAFQSAFVGGEPAGDCDANGVFDILDFVCFQNLFQDGCG